MRWQENVQLTQLQKKKTIKIRYIKKAALQKPGQLFFAVIIESAPEIQFSSALFAKSS